MSSKIVNCAILLSIIFVLNGCGNKGNIQTPPQPSYSYPSNLF